MMLRLIESLKEEVFILKKKQELIRNSPYDVEGILSMTDEDFV